ncbi:O-fucosyltransferase family protein [Paenibacillus caui]|uniref:O-fucosyltransferase family protein n=1 Tax=Paenibacillus caui TaxID=2873927 RepID=UPI001CA852FE|nr:O-fucosyltransferase family protein [Paenibacillus caui]
MNQERFLLIKSWACGFWSAMEHVAGALLIAELTERIPVIFWGADSLYASEDPQNKDAFAMYYQPINHYTIDDVEKDHYTYFPERWNRHNLRFSHLMDISDLNDVPGNFFNRTEQVLVTNVHIALHYFRHLIPEDHPTYGMEHHDVYRYLFQKYFKLQPDVEEEINRFYESNMSDHGPWLGVHIRGTDKIMERPLLYQLNANYPERINDFLERNPSGHIFMLTDSEQILRKFQARFGDRILNTDCLRSPDDMLSVHHHMTGYEGRRKGIEILKDTYLAARCDQFLGASFSNVSIAVLRLKSWANDEIHLVADQF